MISSLLLLPYLFYEKQKRKKNNFIQTIFFDIYIDVLCDC